MTAAVQTRVVLDTTRCQAYGLCVGINPDIFDMPPGSPVAALLRDVVDDTAREDVLEAVRTCPAQAISVAGGP